MASGFFALLDDISALVKASAASLDDVPMQVAKTTGKVSGIVIDDTAVTPKYVVGLDPSRELSIIFRIAKKSLINKLLILSPAALLLGYFAPWAITPILMLGGAYLCYEGSEKVHSMLSKHHKVDPESPDVKVITPEELEKLQAHIDGKRAELERTIEERQGIDGLAQALRVGAGLVLVLAALRLLDRRGRLAFVARAGTGLWARWSFCSHQIVRCTSDCASLSARPPTRPPGLAMTSRIEIKLPGD